MQRQHKTVCIRPGLTSGTVRLYAFVCRWCKCSACITFNKRGVPCSARTVQLHRAQDVQRATATIAAAAAATAAAAAVTASAAAALSSELHRSSKRPRVESEPEVDEGDGSFGGGGDDSFAMSESHEHAISSPTRTPPRSPQDSAGQHTACMQTHASARLLCESYAYANACMLLLAASSSSNSPVSSSAQSSCSSSEPDSEFNAHLAAAVIAPPAAAVLIAAAAAADPAVPDPPKKNLTSLESAIAACKGIHNARVNVNALIDDFLNIGIKHGATQRMQTDIFASLQSILPSVIPSFAIAQRMAEHRSYVSLKEFPVCRNECSILQKTYGELTQNEMQTLACPVCGLLFIQHVKMMRYKPIKVSNSIHLHTNGCGFIHLFADVCPGD